LSSSGGTLVFRSHRDDIRVKVGAARPSPDFS
jgi:hypothetical protein